MGEMHEMYGTDEDGEYNPMDGDVDVEFSDRCVSCDEIYSSLHARLYCSVRCDQEASLVRYARARRADGRIQDPEVREAIEIRLALALGDGYSRRERELPSALRSEIIERDEGRCRICGEPGDEIDHISGSSSNQDNLQLLCRKCHVEKTQAAFVAIYPDDPRYEDVASRGTALMRRIEAQRPLRECDDPSKWPDRWKTILRQRRLDGAP